MRQLRPIRGSEVGSPIWGKVATIPILNSAREAVTNLVKPEGGRYRAGMQVKVLSPEIAIAAEADAVHFVEAEWVISLKAR
ncbi:hypothetical protein M1N50_02645 [Dehalococcoidia bacterium]|nr:hypothetical protein [Dehalococcoidia bacterium]